MEDNLKNIDNLFREELGGYTEAPPPPVWQALEKRLDNDRKRRVFPFRWYWFIGMISFIVLLGASVAWKLNDEKHPSAATADIKTTATQQEVTPASTAAIAASPAAIAPKQKHHKGHAHHKTSNKTAIKTNRKKENIPAIAHRDKPTSGPAAPAPDENNQISASSVYTYEEDVPQPANNMPVAMSSSTTERKQTHGYVVNRIRKHNLIAADMEPVAHEEKTVMRPEPVADENKEIAMNNTDDGTRAATGRHTVKEHKRADNLVSSEPVVHNRKRAAKKTAIVKEHTEAAVAKNDTHPKGTHENKEIAVRKPEAKATTHADIKKMPLAASASNTGGHIADNVPKQTKQGKKEMPVAHKATSTIPAMQTKLSANKAVAAAMPSKPAETTPKHIAPKQTENIHTPQGTVQTSPTLHKPKAATKVIAAVTAPANKAQRNNNIAKQNNPHKEAHNKEGKDTKVAQKQPAPVIAAKAPVASSSVVNTPSKIAEKQMPLKKNREAKHPIKTTTVIASATNKQANSKIPTQAKKTVNKVLPVKPLKSSTNTYATAETISKPAAKVIPSLNKPQITYKANQLNEGAPVEEPSIITPAAQAVVAAKKDEAPAQEIKKTAPAADSNATSTATEDTRAFMSKFVYGIKGGYEGAIGAGGANKAIISPYLEYKISPKFSVMAQPAFKLSHVSKHSIGNDATYFDTSKGMHSYTFLDSSVVHIINGPDMWKRNYTYKETYDSIVKAYSVGGTYMEVELPVMLKYNINPKLCIYGGPNIGYSKYVQVKENTISSPVDITKPVSTLGGLTQPAPDPSTGLGTVVHPGNSIAGYTGPLYPSQQGGSLKLGYMLGFSYEFKKRWMIDALIQQSKTKSYMQGGYNVNTSMSLPYFRLTLGYRLSK